VLVGGKNKPKFTVVQSTNDMYDEEEENVRSNSPANNDLGHRNSEDRFDSLWKRSNTSSNIFNKYT
jgi:hypothetical protein